MEHRQAPVPQVVRHGAARPPRGGRPLPAGRECPGGRARRRHRGDGGLPSDLRWTGRQGAGHARRAGARDEPGPGAGHRPHRRRARRAAGGQGGPHRDGCGHAAGAPGRGGHPRRRPMGLHHLRGLRGPVPGGYRARRPRRRRAPPAGAHGVGLPQGARRHVPQDGVQGEPVGAAGAQAPGLGQEPGLRGAGHRRRRRERRGRRLPVLGGLRRRLRGPGQEDDAGGGRAAAHRGSELRGPRRRRDLHRRPGPARRQRDPLPDARRAERGDPGRGRGAEDRGDLRALLQHDLAGVPADRGPLRGRPLHPAAQPARARGAVASGAAAGRGWFGGVRRPIRLRRPGHVNTHLRAGRRLTDRGRPDVECRGRRAAGRSPGGVVGRRGHR